MARHDTDVDVLYDIKYAFYVGNYQKCINEVRKLEPKTFSLLKCPGSALSFVVIGLSAEHASQGLCLCLHTKSSEPAVNIERDWYLYRSYLAQRKYGLVNDEVKSSSSAILQPLKLLAQYLGSPSSRTTVGEALNSQMNAPIDPDNYGIIIVGATIFIWEQNYEAALRLLHGSKLLECHALMLQVYIKMDRMDMATKVLKKMQEIDDDSVLTNLSQAWLHLAMGGEKLQDAFYVFQELVDKEVITPLILNGLAAVHICQERYPEAESALQEAEHVDSSYAETFLNLSVLSQLTGKSAQESQRYQRLLRDAHPGHWFLSDLDAKEREFDRLSRMFSPSDQS